MTRESRDGSSLMAVRMRLLLGGSALGLAVLDLVAKATAERSLSAGRVVSLGPLDLRLVYNPGTAFSLGAELPSALVLTVVGVITMGVAVFAWREAAKGSLIMVLGLAGVLAGAMGNFVDRADDGTVTDYLHSGWWPTFNLADVFITVGVVAVLIAILRPSRTATDSQRPNGV